MSLLVKPRFWFPSERKVDPKWRWAWRNLAFAYPILDGKGPLKDVGPFRIDATLNAGSDLGTVLSDTGPAKNYDGTANQHYFFASRSDFRFVTFEKWSVACVFSLRSVASSSTLLAKWPSPVSQRQFRIRVNGGTAPRPIEVSAAGATRITTSNIIEANVTYLVVVTLGNSGSTGLSVYVADIETGKVLVNGQTGQMFDANFFSGDVTFGGRDAIDGRFMMAGGWFRELTPTDFVMMARDPFGMFRAAKRAVGFVAAVPTPSHEYLYVHKRSTMSRIQTR